MEPNKPWSHCAQLKSQWADLEEGKNVFEEGNSFTMEALQQQLDQMTALQEYQVRWLPGPRRPGPSLPLSLALLSKHGRVQARHRHTQFFRRGEPAAG